MHLVGFDQHKHQRMYVIFLISSLMAGNIYNFQKSKLCILLYPKTLENTAFEKNGLNHTTLCYFFQNLLQLAQIICYIVYNKYGIVRKKTS